MKKLKFSNFYLVVCLGVTVPCTPRRKTSPRGRDGGGSGDTMSAGQPPILPVWSRDTSSWSRDQPFSCWSRELSLHNRVIPEFSSDQLTAIMRGGSHKPYTRYFLMTWSLLADHIIPTWFSYDLHLLVAWSPLTGQMIYSMVTCIGHNIPTYWSHDPFSMVTWSLLTGHNSLICWSHDPYVLGTWPLLNVLLCGYHDPFLLVA